MADKPIIGISMGDPAGIGPEVIIKAFLHEDVQALADCVVVGDPRIMRQAAGFVGASVKVNGIKTIDAADFSAGTINVYDLGNADPDKFRIGEVSEYCGKAAYDAVEQVITLALDGKIQATVTAPINKAAIKLAGCPFAGHTEIYANLTGTKSYAMMLAHHDFRVIHVSTHVSLMEACRRVKKDRVAEVIRLADESLKQLGIENPRIAVSGLNPHAGEGGLFGREELEEIIPAIEQAKTEGIDASGPFPPDTIFSMAKGGLYDIVVVMYHDQGHIPLKLVGFVYDREKQAWKDVEGVNITVGLPIIRVSVDHGTAFDQAGKGTASESSLVNAINYAARLGGLA